MHDEPDDDYEPEHDQYLDCGDELEEMFGDELDEAAGNECQAQQESAEDDPEDEYQSGLDEDW